MKSYLFVALLMTVPILSACQAPRPKPNYEGVRQNSERAHQDLNQESGNPPQGQ